MPAKPKTRRDGNRKVTRSRKGLSRPPRGRATRPTQISAKTSVQKQREELNIIVNLIPRTNSNRPGTPLHPSKITIHNTDNSDPGADASAHAAYQKGEDAQRRQVSWHFTVDDKNIFQSLPVDEVGWHAGNREGNSKSIGIEICENRGIDQSSANTKAAKLTALLLHELGISFVGNVVQHNSWSGKDCPALLRAQPNGWKDFLQEVESWYGCLGEGIHEREHALPVHLAAVEEPTQVQTDILSTEFGGGNETGMPSAYGGVVNPDQPQASLPARVSTSERRIEVKNQANGKTVTCVVNDVGPWNKHDAYWNSNRRPAAEEQYRDGVIAENGHVPTNDAGLDLTPAAMLALGVTGPVNTRKVRVNWKFV